MKTHLIHRYLFFCVLFAGLCGAVISTHAQYQWHNPINTHFPVIQNQGWQEELSRTYVRLPDRAKGQVREDVWNLSRHSSGLTIHFYCNAPEIRVRYQVKRSLQMPHMPATGVSGVDLYQITSDGDWNFCFGNYAFRDTIQYTYSNLRKDKYHDRGFEYRLYLPLYNEVSWLEIGVKEENELTFIPASVEQPIVLYGTSIAHGACASRPGMSWANIVQRKIDFPLINLGFSGNGRLEKEVLDFVTEIDARLYILDCLPNLVDRKKEEVYQLVLNAVKQIREKHSSPILLVEHIGYSNAQTDALRLELYKRPNEALKKAFETLSADGVENLYYLTREELNIPADGWVDNIHPSDLGMQAQANAVEEKIREILKIPCREK